MTMEKTALTLSLIALAGGSSGGQGLPGKDGSKWYIIKGEGSTSGIPSGAINGDLVLDSIGEIYIVNDGVLVDTEVNLKGEPGKSVYEYAIEYAGYSGTKEEFDILFNKLLSNTYVSQEGMESYVETYVESYVTEAFSDLVLDGGSASL